jgi:hypothetical protein
VPATQLLGDLPIPLNERGRVTKAVDWVDFVDFMKRLEHHTGGVSGLEACGESICEVRPSSMFQSLVGLSASPYSLYRAASLWALRRAIPALETQIEEVGNNRIEIRVRLAEGLRPCPLGSRNDCLDRRFVLAFCTGIECIERGQQERVIRRIERPVRLDDATGCA